MAEVLWWLTLIIAAGFGVGWLVKWARGEDRAEGRRERDLVDEIEEWRQSRGEK